MIFVVHTSESDAFATCARIDAHLGYPRTDLDQLGREVRTERYAEPMPLTDGRWLVPVSAEIAQACDLTVTDLDPTTLPRPSEMEAAS